MSDAPRGHLLRLRGVASLDGTMATVLIDGDRIAAVGPDADAARPEAAEVDARGLTAVPGFIDLQVNGAAGHDITSDPESIWDVGRALTRYGVTAFLPTIVTSPPAAIERAQAVLAAGPPAGYVGARPLGLHVEGPFLSPERRGVHDPALLREPDPTLARTWAPASGVRLVTLAPELPGALGLIADLASRGVVVSAGHSAATFDEGVAAVEAGVRYATHLFNGMAPLDHRAPGIVGALLRDDRVTIGMIADGVHVHPAVVGLVWRLVGPDRFSAVTDALAALGSDASTRLGHADVAVAGSEARVGARLAGGVIGLDAIVRNLVAASGVPVAGAIRAVTSVPAALLSLDDPYDGVDAGRCADLTLLTADLRVAATIVGGRIAWSAPDRPELVA